MNVSFEEEVRKLCKDLEWEEVILVLLGVLDGVNGENEVYDDFKMSIETYKDDKKKKEQNVGMCQQTVRDRFKDLPTKTEINTILNEVPSAEKINTVLEDIKAEIKKWYFQADKQALAKDPCVVDAMIDLFIRTIDKYKAEREEN